MLELLMLYRNATFQIDERNMRIKVYINGRLSADIVFYDRQLFNVVCKYIRK
jgi:hypothetical protein